MFECIFTWTYLQKKKEELYSQEVNNDNDLDNFIYYAPEIFTNKTTILTILYNTKENQQQKLLNILFTLSSAMSRCLNSPLIS